jgi:hypothetical protein
MAVVSNNRAYRWHNGIVPFVISGDFPENSKGRIEILTAINEINSRTNVTFVEYTNQPNYVVFVYDEKWCTSWIGMLGGKQEIRCAIGRNFKAGSLIHEILHCLGFYHEHQRPDRDSYVSVNMGNIKNNTDFLKLNSSLVDMIGTYDYSSIMHYPRRIANPNLVKDTSKDTIEPIKILPLETILGQRGALSSADVAGINALYPQKTKEAITYDVPNRIQGWQIIVGATILIITTLIIRYNVKSN